jgi:hypothetical protein
MKRKIMLGASAGLIGALAIAGAAFAQEGAGDGNPRDSIKDRVAEILGVDREDLDTAMKTARDEFKEAKQEERLAELVTEGVITQEQADEIDAWTDARPEVMDGLKRALKGHVPGQMPPADGEGIEARLAALVEQEVITQAEADEVIAWHDAKPEYLDELRQELRGERDGNRGQHGRKHRGGNGKHRGPGGPGQFGQASPEDGTGTTFTLPNGSEISV